jgi:spore maturation protein SpmB
MFSLLIKKPTMKMQENDIFDIFVNNGSIGLKIPAWRLPVLTRLQVFAKVYRVIGLKQYFVQLLQVSDNQL